MKVKELIPFSISDEIINRSRHFTIWVEDEILNGEEPLGAVLNLAKTYSLIFY